MSFKSRTSRLLASLPHFVFLTSSNDKPLCLENPRREAAELFRYGISATFHFRLNQGAFSFSLVRVRMLNGSGREHWLIFSHPRTCDIVALLVWTLLKEQGEACGLNANAYLAAAGRIH